LRGAVVGEHAVLRMQGLVAVENHPAQSWRFEEQVQVSWSLNEAGHIVERRRGRIQVYLASKMIELERAEPNEILASGSSAHILARSSQALSLIVPSGPLSTAEAWVITDDPAQAVLPAGVPGYRVYRAATASEQPALRRVFETRRSDWHAAFGHATPGTALVWHSQGHLAAWRGAVSISDAVGA